MIRLLPFLPRIAGFIARFQGLARLRPSGFAAWMVYLVVTMSCVQMVLEWQWFWPDARRLAQEQVRQQARLAHIATARRMAASASPDPLQVRLDDVLHRLRSQPDIQERIVQMHDMAARRGVLVRHAGYRNLPADSGVARLEIQADLSGSYPAVRLFLRDWMQTDPAAAIGSIDFARPPGMDGVVTRARLILFSAP